MYDEKGVQVYGRSSISDGYLREIAEILEDCRTKRLARQSAMRGPDWGGLEEQR